MWIVAITGFCFGIAFAGVVYRLRMWNNAGKELRARKALEKAVRWIFERRTLKNESLDALLLESVACGCHLDDLLERRIALFTTECCYPPGKPFHLFGITMAYLYPYLPKDRQLLEEDRMIGEKLYNFKRGEYVPGLENEICALFERLGLEKGGYTLLCMPASNWERTEIRYRRLSSDLSTRMNWTDGFGTLIPVSREPVHLTGRRRPMGTEDFMLDKRMLKGKKILLLDDLLTTGMTVLSVASLLRDAGLTPVAAVFVGRTIEKAVRWQDLAAR